MTSFEISITHLRDVIYELSELDKKVMKQNHDFTCSIEDVENAKILTQNFKEYIKDFNMNDKDKVNNSKYHRPYIV